MNRIKLGISGTNFVSDWLAEAAALTPDIDLTSVLSRSFATRQAARVTLSLRSV